MHLKVVTLLLAHTFFCIVGCGGEEGSTAADTVMVDRHYATTADGVDLALFHYAPSNGRVGPISILLCLVESHSRCENSYTARLSADALR